MSIVINTNPLLNGLEKAYTTVKNMPAIFGKISDADSKKSRELFELAMSDYKTYINSCSQDEMIQISNLYKMYEKKYSDCVSAKIKEHPLSLRVKELPDIPIEGVYAINKCLFGLNEVECDEIYKNIKKHRQLYVLSNVGDRRVAGFLKNDANFIIEWYSEFISYFIEACVYCKCGLGTVTDAIRKINKVFIERKNAWTILL